MIAGIDLMNKNLFRRNIDKYRSDVSATKAGFNKARVFSVASGKGGVGKTFFSTNFARFLEMNNKKVLLIDCDVFLSNCYLSLGVTPTKDLFDLIRGEDISNCITSVGNIDLLSGRSGNDTGISSSEYTKMILGVIQSSESKYDFIILDCPAGIENKILSLMAYADERVIVMNPDKYSFTVSYSLIKTLRSKYGVLDFNAVINKCDTLDDESNIFGRIISTCHTFLPDVKVRSKGRIPRIENKINSLEENSTTYKIFNNLFSHLDDSCIESGLFGQHQMKMEFHLSF